MFFHTPLSHIYAIDGSHSYRVLKAEKYKKLLYFMGSFQNERRIVPNEKWIKRNDGKRIEDLALRRALNEWKDDIVSKRKPVAINSRDNFLLGLRSKTPDVQYLFVSSPDFKPGNYYIYPNGVSSRSYKTNRIPFLSQTSSPGNQLCTEMRRKIFCEVLQEEKLCLDCNARHVRNAFNEKINNEYPYLEYDPVKRPYGFCPRAVRLTEPLPFKGEKISWHINCDCTRTRSSIFPNMRKSAERNGWMEPRPFTT